MSAVFIRNIFAFFYLFLFLSLFSCVPGDVLHGSPGHQDPLEADGVPVGAARLCPGR